MVKKKKMCLKRIDDWCEKRWEWCKEHKPLGIFILLIIVLAVPIGFFFFCAFTPPSESVGTPIDVEPKKLNVSLSPGENFNKTISIYAYEAGDVNIANATEPMKKWVNFSNNENVSVDAGRTYYVNVEFEIPENATPGEYKGTIKITHNQFLFSWDDVLGNDSKGLRRSLKDVYKIDWAENAKISKLHDNKTITIIKGLVPICRDEAKITINEKEEKATLKINDGDPYDLKKENDTRNIYRRVKEEIPIILTIKPREIILKNVSILLVPQNQGKGYA